MVVQQQKSLSRNEQESKYGGDHNEKRTGKLKNRKNRKKEGGIKVSFSNQPVNVNTLHINSSNSTNNRKEESSGVSAGGINNGVMEFTI